ncbi:hypothetical protein AVEN_162390-1, partial [Araneus ventricosus]
MKFQET